MRQNTTRYEPFYLTYGRDAVLPIDLQLPVYTPEPINDQNVDEQYLQRISQLIGPVHDDRQKAQLNIEKAQEKQIRLHERKISNYDYRIGDKVLLKNFRSKKMDPKWVGLYYIHDIKPNGTYKLRTIDGKLRKKLVHGDQIVPYNERPNMASE